LDAGVVEADLERGSLGQAELTFAELIGAFASKLGVSGVVSHESSAPASRQLAGRVSVGAEPGLLSRRGSA